MEARIDFTDAPSFAQDGDQMTVLRGLVKDLREAQLDEKEKEASLKQAKAILAELRDRKVPQHAKAMGFGGGKISLPSGAEYKLDLKTDVFGGIGDLEDDVARAKAFDYMEYLKEGPSIKRVLTITLDADSRDAEMRIRAGVQKVAERMGRGDFQVTSEVTVHPSTLRKIARDRLENGREIDLPILGLVAVTRASVK